MHRALLFLVCACGRIGFDATGGAGPGGDDQNSDGGTSTDGGGSGSGSGTAMCTGMITPASTFPGGIACGNWGANQQVTNAGISESSGTLTITPNANSGGAEADCLHSNVTMTSAGTTAEVSQILAGTSSQTRLELIWGGETYFIGGQNNTLHYGAVSAGVDLTRGAFNLAQHRWWHMYVAAGSLHWEISGDGINWTDIGDIGANPTGLASLRVVGRTPNAEAAPGSAKFESVNYCP